MMFGIVFGIMLGMTGATDNIALHAPYTLEFAPNYAHCTDADDARQLTDGAYVEGHFWTQPGTVGWQGVKPVIVTIDLGADKPIGGVSYNTAAGAAGVTWPTAVFVFVAGEDKQFRMAGELMEMSAAHGVPAPEGYAIHRFWTDALATHGRYVALGVWCQPYTFVDEIEVYAGAPELLASTPPGEPLPDMKACMENLAIYTGVMRRLRNDLAALREEVKNPALDAAVRDAAAAELDAIEQAFGQVAKTQDADFRAVLPLNPLHERLLAVHGRVLNGMGISGIQVWMPPQAYAFLPLLAVPPKQDNPAVKVRLMPGECRAAAVNITNATTAGIPVTVTITGLPGGDNPAWAGMHKVLWTDTAPGIPVAAALDPAAPGQPCSLIIPAGMTRQVWLAVHPVNITPGTYSAVIDIAAGDAHQAVPLEVAISKLKFPERPRLHMGGWDYTDQPAMYQATAENRAALIEHLRERFVDSPWGTSACMLFGKYDATGAMTEPPDTTHFDTWIERWPDAAQYCVFAAVSNVCAGFAAGTPEFTRAVGEWASFWTAHAAGKGLKPGQLVALLVDEPSAPEHDAVIIAWSKAMRAAGSGIRIWEDPIHADMAKADPGLGAACDVLCPNRPLFIGASDAYRAWYVEQRDKGVALEFYSCSGPARLLDPYAYYRLQAWTCWEYGAGAMHFWAFADGGGTFSFNEYLVKNSAYTPLFIEPGRVMAGKQMEACREGVEDFEYLAMLKDAVAAASGDRAKKEAVAAANQLLEGMPGRVLAPASKNLNWSAEMERGAADAVRLEILEALEALQ